VFQVAGIVVLGFCKSMTEGNKLCALCAILQGRLETDSYLCSAVSSALLLVEMDDCCFVLFFAEEI